MWTELMIISCVVAVAAVGLCVTITFCVYRSRKKTKGKEVSSPNGQTFGSREPLAAHNSKEDIGMIVNELYSSSEPQGESIMITNDIYEGSGDTERRSTAPALAPGYEEVKIDAGNGTVAMVSTKTTGNNAGVYANTAEADAQRKKEQEKEKNKKRPKERAPGPPASGLGEAKKNKKESNKKEKEASPSKSKAQTNAADAKSTNTAEKPEKGRNSGKKEAKPNSTEKTATTGNPTNDENKKANADASKTKPDAAKTKSDPAKTKTDASKSKSDPAKHDAPGAKADAPDTNANARTKTDANEGAASNDDQGSILVDARVPNAEGCLYGQLDFSRVKPRTTVIKDLPSTDYAEINFKAPPPPAPEN
ncbi:cylicin-2-like [Littorina saxatilis]|uniref:cylicin-2-like n=1 Tax=Littorina saxatilis TaxID=31220 RepID=UPI0038B66A99